MSVEPLIPEAFFVEKLSAEEADRMLAPLVERVEIRDALVDELVEVARREHPLSRRLIAAVQARMDALSEDGTTHAGFLIASIPACCEHAQRVAAARALGRFLPDERAFTLLWDSAVAPDSRVRDAAILAIADDLPNHVEFLLAAYRAPYVQPPVDEKRKGTYQDFVPKALAAFALIAGIAQCGPELQAEIRRTVTFRVDDVHCDSELKDSTHAECRYRTVLIQHLSGPFGEEGYGNPVLAARIRAAIGEHFLADFLTVFTDRATMFDEALRIAKAWPDDPRVLDALAEYLERWGGTFFNEHLTKNVLHALSLPGVPVTPRILAAVALVEAKPMDAPYEGLAPRSHIGSCAAETIREAAAAWRKRKAIEIAALNVP